MARQILGKVVPTGEDTYDNNRTYDELCIVMYNGQSYISKKETRGNKPDNTEYWQQLVEKPVKGTDYFTEADKDEIVNDVTNDATNKYNQAVKTGIEKFDQNAERKTSDFNDNASEKTDTYNANADSATKAFTNNANSKTEAYNTNATEKLGAYNSNHTAKLKEYNDNATSKLSAYNTNSVTKTTEYNSNHTNKLNAYNANASSKIDEYNTNADTRLEEYNTNADTKINEYDEHSKELNNKIVSTRNELERLKSNVLNTGEDTDTFIHLEDSAMAELQELSVDGVLQQETTKGVNLIKLSDGEFSSNGIIAKVNKGIITINGTSTAQTYLVITNIIDRPTISFKGYYTLSLNTITDSIDVSVYGDNNGSQLIINSAQNIKTVVINGTYESIRMQLNIPANKTYNNYILRPQLESGQSATSFEPYTGRQPSPSPDYPQEIKTITGNLKLTSCGKNLFNFDNMLENMAWDENGLTGNSLAIAVNKHQDIHSSAITFSVDFNQNSGTQGRLLVYDKNKTLISNNAIVTFPFTKVFESNAKYYTYYFLKKQIPINSKIQLELSNTASEYVPYVESQIQAKLPEGEFIGKLDDTYKDTLRTKYFPEEGQYHWMLDKKIKKVTFTGADNEKWIITDNYKGLYQFNIRVKDVFCDTLNQLLIVLKSNYFLGTNWDNHWTRDNIILAGINKDAIIRVVTSKFTSINDFKSWLSEHNLEVYYLLAKPYTIDLGAIDMPMSYKDITNIFTDSDLLPTINAKYYRVFDKTIQNAQINEKTLKQEITDLNATVSALDNRLKALETKTVEEPTESEGTV